MLRKTRLVVGSIILGMLGFSLMLVTMVRKNNFNRELKLNANYYDHSEESLFILKNHKE
ncbi:hypothetical protein B834_2549 [Enterococcus mundtii 1A]|uniref:hypothetical protein n=1 Tax=Enterococcus mundtii TaxID=53346 RepID=UPI00044D0771|nr:hypothetical protein [Enterococcus mundtii]EYT96694.1 hypothetical protein AK89_02335 [Enterococcus mundtii CRL35]MDA9430023.1 hypothetical protein [Enterococcus mundtii 1A]MDO7879140.1 hypothetical protein [Enterococcus mundtii]MEC3940596.1 hypothetical protein [Enterococcus mundtii]